MSASPPDLRETRDAGVVRLTLARPDRRNALSESMLETLGEALARVAADPVVRAVVIAAEGSVFSSGHDLTELTDREPSEYERLFARCTRVMTQIRHLPQPVLARVQGHAVAAGCQLAATCDLAVAAPHATFSTPGVKVGLFCATPMVPLARAIPPKAALEMLLTGLPISADRALALGLVNRVAEVDQLDAVLSEWTDAIVAASPRVVRGGKALFREGLALDEPAAYDRATRDMAQNASGAEAREGIAAFLQKRPPRWPN